MNYDEISRRRRSLHADLGFRRGRFVAIMHALLGVAFIVNPAYGAILLPLLVLLTAGEESPAVERDALEALNFAFVATIGAFVAVLFQRAVAMLAGPGLVASIPLVVLCFWVLWNGWRAFKRTITGQQPRYPRNYWFVQPKRTWFAAPEKPALSRRLWNRLRGPEAGRG